MVDILAIIVVDRSNNKDSQNVMCDPFDGLLTRPMDRNKKIALLVAVDVQDTHR
jgi:hypothetical protein